MARILQITNVDRSITVDIAPDNGGMITQIHLGEKEIFRLRGDDLEMAPMLAGGMPLLFPFPSKTAGYSYKLNGKEYGMPMHGLLKNAAFAVKSLEENRIVLWTGSNPSWQEAQYPFPFRLELCYAVEGNTVSAVATVYNDSDQPMPHYLGWHPFFKATEKEKLSMSHAMTCHYDYNNHTDTAAPQGISLSQWWDDVFHTPKTHGFTLRNEKDGYAVSCQTDDAFDVLVVCTWVEGSVCIEPWCGVPDDIHQKRFVRWIPPESKETYTIQYQIAEIA